MRFEWYTTCHRVVAFTKGAILVSVEASGSVERFKRFEESSMGCRRRRGGEQVAGTGVSEPLDIDEIQQNITQFASCVGFLE